MNRWAPFTDDDLRELTRAVPDDEKPLWKELEAERERRAGLVPAPLLGEGFIRSSTGAPDG